MEDIFLTCVPTVYFKLLLSIVIFLVLFGLVTSLLVSFELNIVLSMLIGFAVSFYASAWVYFVLKRGFSKGTKEWWEFWSTHDDKEVIDKNIEKKSLTETVIAGFKSITPVGWVALILTAALPVLLLLLLSLFV